MYLTPVQTICMILAVAAGTAVTRFAPFLLFPEKRRIPKFVEYLGKALPPAMMGLLVVFSFKAVNVTVSPFGLPELIATACIVLLHCIKGNVLLSIGAGTAIYMLLVQLVFR